MGRANLCVTVASQSFYVDPLKLGLYKGLFNGPLRFLICLVDLIWFGSFFFYIWVRGTPINENFITK